MICNYWTPAYRQYWKNAWNIVFLKKVPSTCDFWFCNVRGQYNREYKCKFLPPLRHPFSIKCKNVCELFNILGTITKTSLFPMLSIFLPYFSYNFTLVRILRPFFAVTVMLLAFQEWFLRPFFTPIFVN